MAEKRLWQCSGIRGGRFVDDAFYWRLKHLIILNLCLQEMSSILIIGGAGFVGSSLSNMLCEQNVFTKIFVVGRSLYPKFSLNPIIEYVQGDAGDACFLSKIMDHVDSVIDLSYSTVPKTSYENPLSEATLNLPACINVMQQCIVHGVKRYLLVSSGGTVYGNTSEPLITESHSTNPISPYGISKLMTEKFALFFCQNFGLPVVIARPSNPYGVQQIGNRPQGFIGNAISCLIKRCPLDIYGDNGSIRDYIYIDDLSRALRDCILYGVVGNIYNIGTGIGYDNYEVLNFIESVFFARFERIRKLPGRPFDVNKNILNSSSVSLLNHWRPEFDIHSGLVEIRKQL
jgi:UDP-glucose 4-epimerase